MHVYSTTYLSLNHLAVQQKGRTEEEWTQRTSTLIPPTTLSFRTVRSSEYNSLEEPLCPWIRNGYTFLRIYLSSNSLHKLPEVREDFVSGDDIRFIQGIIWKYKENQGKLDDFCASDTQRGTPIFGHISESL